MEHAQGSTCLRLLGDFVQVNLGYPEEGDTKQKAAWRAYLLLAQNMLGETWPRSGKVAHVYTWQCFLLRRGAQNAQHGLRTTCSLHERCSSGCHAERCAFGNGQEKSGRNIWHDAHITWRSTKPILEFRDGSGSGGMLMAFCWPHGPTSAHLSTSSAFFNYPMARCVVARDHEKTSSEGSTVADGTRQFREYA